MELEIYEALAKYFVNIKIEVGYVDIRLYQINIRVETEEYIIKYQYDARLTFDANIDIIKKEIEKWILKYLSHKARRLQDKVLIYTINGKNVSRKQFEIYNQKNKRIKENERSDNK